MFRRRSCVSLRRGLHDGDLRLETGRLGPEACGDVGDPAERLAAERATEDDLAVVDPVLGQRIELEAHAEARLFRVAAPGHDVGVEPLRKEDARLPVLDGDDGETRRQNLLVAEGLGQPEAHGHESGLLVAVGDLVVAGQVLEDLDRGDGTCSHWITSGRSQS